MASDKLAKDIGNRIATRRKQLGLTQEQAAEKADLTQQFFALVEAGTKNIRADSIVKVSAALDISPDYILTGKVSNLDRSRLVDLLQSVDADKYMKLEEIIAKIVEYGT